MIGKSTFFIIFFFTTLLLGKSIKTFSQNLSPVDSIIVDSIDSGDWKPGYIIYKKSTDTIFGFLKIRISNIGEIKKVWFQNKILEKKGAIKFGNNYLPEDTVRFFGFEEKRYKYVNYTDESFPRKKHQEKHSLNSWCEIIEEGAINLSKGFNLVSSVGAMPAMSPGSIVGVSTTYTLTPKYILKKGQLPSIIIEDKSISIFREESDYMLYEIDLPNKEHFINLICEYDKLVEIIYSKKLRFRDIENYIKQYNIWAKENKLK